MTNEFHVAMKTLIDGVPEAMAIVEAAKKKREAEDMPYLICDNCGLALGEGFLSLGKKHDSDVCHEFVKSGIGHFRPMTPREKKTYKAKVKGNGAMRFNEKGECLFYPAHKNNDKHYRRRLWK